MRLEHGVIGLAAAAALAPEASAHPTKKRETNNGWSGKDVVTVVETSPIFSDYNYTTCKNKLPEELKKKLPVSNLACLFPQDPGTIHLLPNSDCFTPLLKNPKAKIDSSCSVSSIVLTLKDNSTTVEDSQFWVHPEGEKLTDGDHSENLNSEVDQYLRESTGSKDLKSEEFADAAMNCGPNAVLSGTGEKFKKDVDGYEVQVLQGKGEEKKVPGTDITNHDCYIKASKIDTSEDTPTNTWIGKNVADTINNSPLIDELKYAACSTTAVKVSPTILKNDQRVCSYPEKKETVTLVPDPPFFEELSNTTKEYWTLLKDKDNVDNHYSLSTMNLAYDDKQHIQSATLLWPAEVIGFRNAHGGKGTESTDILLPWLKEVTGIQDIDPEDGKELADAAMNCGAHREHTYEDGNNYSKQLGKFTALVGGGEREKRNHERSFRRDLLGDCGITISLTPKKKSTPEENAAPTLRNSKYSPLAKAAFATAVSWVASRTLFR